MGLLLFFLDAITRLLSQTRDRGKRRRTRGERIGRVIIGIRKMKIRKIRMAVPLHLKATYSN